jgi:two-component system OmpR family sensor kinase
MNRQSIFFKLNTIFVVTIVSLLLHFIATLFMSKIKNNREFIEKSIRVHKILGIIEHQRVNTKETIDSIIVDNKLQVINNNKKEILANAEDVGSGEKEKKVIKKILTHPENFKPEGIGERPPPPLFRDRFRRPPPHLRPPHHKRPILRVLEYKGDRYIYTKSKEHDLLLKDLDNDYITVVLALVAVSFSIIFIISLAYYLLRKNLLSIKTLHKGIKDYADGHIDTTMQNNRQDEVSIVSNEFYNTILKVDRLQESRKFLLRNMMHELKTPLTKSKLYLGFLEDDDIKEKLENSLNRLEILINEMANIEKISSSNIDLNPKSYRLADIIDDSIDSLFISSNTIDTKLSSNRYINVDFKLFAILLKNLIDNALKYSDDKRASIEYIDDKISIISKGKRLEYPLDRYIEPFFKGDLNSTNQKGFGLGLYIVSQIAKKHNFKLEYSYKDANNIFSIVL